MPLRIVSKKAGFRRCGQAFTGTAADYPDGTFTPEEVKILKAEPMLVVVEVPDEPETDKKPAKK